MGRNWEKLSVNIVVVGAKPPYFKSNIIVSQFLQKFSVIVHTEGSDGRATPLPRLEIDPVNTDDVDAALKHTKPSARQLKGKYQDWQKEYESV